MSIYENPEEEIERITKAREALSEELTDLLNWKQKRQDLVECEKDGHMWVMNTVKSDLWVVEEIHISCPRCDALYCARPMKHAVGIARFLDKLILSDFDLYETGLTDADFQVIDDNETKTWYLIGWAKGLKAIKDLYGKGTS
jgi:hypothetical protein